MKWGHLGFLERGRILEKGGGGVDLELNLLLGMARKRNSWKIIIVSKIC